MTSIINILVNSDLQYQLNIDIRLKIFKKLHIDYLNILPTELIEEIVSSLDIYDLYNLCQANLKYQYLCSDSYIINKVKIQNLENYYNNLEILKILIKYRKDIIYDQLNKVFIEACKNGYLEIAQLLLADERVNPAAQDNQAILTASLSGHLEIVKLLLTDERINPADQNNWAIRFASCLGHLDIVQLLLTDERVNPAVQDNYAIINSSLYGHTKVVKLLLSDPRVNPEHLTYYEFYQKLYR